MPVSLTEMKSFFIPDGGLDVNDRILVAEFDRVVDQVVENLLEFFRDRRRPSGCYPQRSGQNVMPFALHVPSKVAAVSLIVRLISKLVRVK